jgi:hypothetical protein
MQMMGTWAWTARWKAPFLNGRSSVLAFLVPSGKIQTRSCSEISENQLEMNRLKQFRGKLYIFFIDAFG